ncbi:MAG TPA: GNAT family N-acetyltransferase [Solirubrobacteraceae bacterium]|nr:GNAT family N-acetyltransferase [Solirubrobacteraceae bacterium]
MEIRPLEPSDGAAVYLALLSDPEITAWFGPGGERTLEEAEVMAIRKAAHRTVHGFGWSVAWEGGECLGWAVAQHAIIDGFSEVELGWSVARAHWRQGIATALGRHALAEVSGRGLRSVVAYTDEGNVASRGVMAKLGMSYEKTFQDDGERHVLYRLALEP